MLDKTYEPAAIEARIHAAWMKAEAFKAGRPERAEAPAYCIVIPPPNVTGSLHMGHALGGTLQDTLIRWRRMQGFNAMWMPGTDHAGIATQMLVERDLKRKEGKSRHELGRDAFLQRVWQWKERYGGRIGEQLRLMGFSLDWERAVYDTIMFDNTVKLAKDFAAKSNDTLIIVVPDHAHPVSLIGTYDDSKGEQLRDRLQTFAKAGYPNYPAADTQGYPETVDVSRRLAVVFAAYPDYCDPGKPYLGGENQPTAPVTGSFTSRLTV